MSQSKQELALPRHAVQEILRSHGEGCNQGSACYYPTLESLVEKAGGSRHWSIGEVFVWAESPERFVVLKQVAPESCEMFAVTEKGFIDVFSANRMERGELVAKLGGSASPAESLLVTEGAISSKFVELRETLFRAASILRMGEQLAQRSVQLTQAADVCASVRTVLFAIYTAENDGTASAGDLRGQILAGAQLCAQEHSNGLGDTVIWPAFRRGGLHREAEEWTAVTNDMRRLRLELKNLQQLAETTKASVEGVPQPTGTAAAPTAGSDAAKIESLRQTCAALYHALDDASSVVDKGSDEQYAYQAELELGAAELGLSRGAVERPAPK